MADYELVLISMGHGFAWHCLVCGEYSPKKNPPRTVSRARREAAVHLRQAHGVASPSEGAMRVASYNELFSLRVFG